MTAERLGTYNAGLVADSAKHLYEALVARGFTGSDARDFVVSYFKGAGVYND